jgi:hypothetical protein
MGDLAKHLGVKKVMESYPVREDATGLELWDASWQEGETGDTYVSADKRPSR